jgi:hypothetical protein
MTTLELSNDSRRRCHNLEHHSDDCIVVIYDSNLFLIQATELKCLYLASLFSLV